MKNFMKWFMAVSVWLYRKTGGKLGGKMRGFNVLLLNTTGRKSGRQFTTPLGWFEHADGYVIVASNGGKPAHPAWYFNLTASPHVTVQVLERVVPVTAEVLTGEARTQAWKQVIATAPSYANYEKQTAREIPLILLRPERIKSKE